MANKISPEKKLLIKNLKKAAQKATSKVIEMTFDTNIRNTRTREINQVLQDNIQKVMAL